MTKKFEKYKEYNQRVDEQDLEPGDFISFKLMSAKLAEILSLKTKDITNVVNGYWKKEMNTEEFGKNECSWVILEIRDDIHNEFLKLPIMVDVLGVRKTNLERPRYKREDYTGKRYINFNEMDGKVEFSLGLDIIWVFTNEARGGVLKTVPFIISKGDQEDEEIDNWEFECELEADYGKYDFSDEDE